MTVITFTNPKGGSSKSTSALILASTLVHFGQRTAIIDCDVNAPMIRWAEGRNDKDLTVVGAKDREVMHRIEELRKTHAYVLVDTEGTANTTTGYALSRADLAILPFSMSQLDVDQAGKAIEFIEDQALAIGRQIPYRLLFTKTNAGFQTRVERTIRNEAQQDQVSFFETTIMMRQAYIEMFSRKATVFELPEDAVSGVPRAIENAIAYAKEVVDYANGLIQQGRAA